MKTLWATAVTETKTTDVEGIGRLRYEGDKIYRWVYNADTITLALGSLACHTFGGGDDTFKSVKEPLTANLSLLGGVVTATDGIPTLNYGWIQVQGYNANVSVFQSQTSVRTLGTIYKAVNSEPYAEFDVAVGTAPTLVRNLQILETVATVTTGAAATKKMYINCL